MTRIPYFQEGGGAPMPEQGGAPMEGGGGDPTAQIQAMVQEWAQTQDPQLAQEIVGMLAEAMGIPVGGGQGAPAPQGPPMEGEPAYRSGGKMVSAYDKLKAFKQGK